ncbi:MAG: deaminase domain-containing protein, partial [Myxococcota bacterium]
TDAEARHGQEVLRAAEIQREAEAQAEAAAMQRSAQARERAFQALDGQAGPEVRAYVTRLFDELAGQEVQLGEPPPSLSVTIGPNGMQRAPANVQRAVRYPEASEMAARIEAVMNHAPSRVDAHTRGLIEAAMQSPHEAPEIARLLAAAQGLLAQPNTAMERGQALLRTANVDQTVQLLDNPLFREGLSERSTVDPWPSLFRIQADSPRAFDAAARTTLRGHILFDAGVLDAPTLQGILAESDSPGRELRQRFVDHLSSRGLNEATARDLWRGSGFRRGELAWLLEDGNLSRIGAAVEATTQNHETPVDIATLLQRIGARSQTMSEFRADAERSLLALEWLNESSDPIGTSLPRLARGSEAASLPRELAGWLENHPELLNELSASLGGPRFEPPPPPPQATANPELHRPRRLSELNEDELAGLAAEGVVTTIEGAENPLYEVVAGDFRYRIEATSDHRLQLVGLADGKGFVEVVPDGEGVRVEQTGRAPASVGGANALDALRMVAIEHFRSAEHIRVPVTQGQLRRLNGLLSGTARPSMTDLQRALPALQFDGVDYRLGIAGDPQDPELVVDMVPHRSESRAPMLLNPEIYESAAYRSFFDARLRAAGLDELDRTDRLSLLDEGAPLDPELALGQLRAEFAVPSSLTGGARRLLNELGVSAQGLSEVDSQALRGIASGDPANLGDVRLSQLSGPLQTALALDGAYVRSTIESGEVGRLAAVLALQGPLDVASTGRLMIHAADTLRAMGDGAPTTRIASVIARSADMGLGTIDGNVVRGRVELALGRMLAFHDPSQWSLAVEALVIDMGTPLERSQSPISEAAGMARVEAIRDRLGTPEVSRNVAYADFIGLTHTRNGASTGSIEALSGRPTGFGEAVRAAGGLAEQGEARSALLGHTGEADHKFYDTEWKILEQLAHSLTPESTGRVTLFSEKPICPSCQMAIARFRRMFPNVELTINSGNQN